MQSAIVYCRFSPRPNASECESLAWQKDECRKYASKKGYIIDAFFDDPDVSGADSVRPVMWEAVSSLKKGDVLLVWKWDRLARDLLLQLQIERAVEKQGATVEAVVGDAPGNDPQSKFMRHILGAVAELERAMIGQRTSVSMRAKQRAGLRMSARTPYGWKVDPADSRKLIADEAEQAVRFEILELHRKGFGYRKIANTLNERGVKTRKGTPWPNATIGQIIRKSGHHFDY